MRFGSFYINLDAARSGFAPPLLSGIAVIAAALFFALTGAVGARAHHHDAFEASATSTPVPLAPDSAPAPLKRTPPLGNLDSMLSQIAASVQGGYSTANDAASQAPLHTDDSVAVTFYLNGAASPLVAFLRANGGDPRNIGEDYVEAYVPVTLLVEASERPNVLRARAITPPQPARGDLSGQGARARGALDNAGYIEREVNGGIMDGGFEVD